MTMQRVQRSAIIDAPIGRVWEILRDFNSHTEWHPIVASSSIEGGEPSDRVGCVRSFVLRDGAHVREQLIALSDREHRFTYCILDADVPLERYVATVQLKPVTDGNRTFWHWQSTFRTPAGRERELADLVGRDVYEGGIAGLRRYLQQGARFAQPDVAGDRILEGDAVTFERTGGPDVLVMGRAAARPPAPGEARVRHTAIGVNFLDVYVRRGSVPLASPGMPLGVEAAGVVVDVGAEVANVVPGDRVAYAMLPPGAYCQVRTVPASQLVRLPDSVDDVAAASVLLKGLTAEFLLFRLHPLRAGETVLVHAAAGGLGSLVCPWARALGARVIGTVSSESKAREARERGCHEVIVTREYNFADALKRATGGRGADLIIDGLGEKGVRDNVASLARFGHWISIGDASGPLPPLSPDALIHQSATFSRPVIFHYTEDPVRLSAMAERLWDALGRSVIRPPPGTTFPLQSAAEAHRRLESRATTGALVLVP
ncbi:MAG: SRPBCC family protein [Betaproteobacteria bacterium]|nr:SRPBCC family protein [Betaproteobacteria bacterium]